MAIPDIVTFDRAITDPSGGLILVINGGIPKETDVFSVSWTPNLFFAVTLMGKCCRSPKTKSESEK